VIRKNASIRVQQWKSKDATSLPVLEQRKQRRVSHFYFYENLVAANLWKRFAL